MRLCGYIGNDVQLALPDNYNGNSYQIDSYAFSNNVNLTSVSIPSGVTDIGDYAFNGCSSLTSVVIPSTITSIGLSAFQGCSNLSAISIPSDVTNIRFYAFSDCSNLKTVRFEDSKVKLEQLGSVNENANVEELYMGRNIDACWWPALKFLTISNKVTEFYPDAFKKCNELKAYVKSAAPASLSEDPGFCTTATIYVPIGTLSAYKSAWNIYQEQINESASAGALLDETAAPQDVITEATKSNEGVDITFRRMMTKDKWSSFVVPFSMTSDEVECMFGEGTKIAKLKSSTADKITLAVQQTNVIEANEPVLVLATKDVSEEYLKSKIVEEGNAETTIGNASLIGTYNRLTGNQGNNTYFLSNGELIPTSYMGTMNPFRAYIRLANVNDVKPILEIDELDGSTTSIHITESHDVKDGNDEVYELSGRCVDDSYRGIIVKKGKKFINK